MGTFRAVTPSQTTGKWTFGIEGELHIARRSRPVTPPAALPAELRRAIDSPLAGVRAGAVQELAGILLGRHAGKAMAAELALEQLTADDSRGVPAAATTALGAKVPPTLSLPVTSIDFGPLPSTASPRNGGSCCSIPAAGPSTRGRPLRRAGSSYASLGTNWWSPPIPAKPGNTRVPSPLKATADRASSACRRGSSPRNCLLRRLRRLPIQRQCRTSLRPSGLASPPAGSGPRRRLIHRRPPGPASHAGCAGAGEPSDRSGCRGAKR